MNPPGGVVRLRLSSTLAVDAGDGARSGRELGSRKARTLLALLAASRGRPVATDRIVAALWPEAPPADPAANVATLVSRVRRTLGAGLVEGRPGAYALGGSWSLDLVEAEQWVAEAAGRLAAGEHALAESAAAAALELLGGETALLDEVDDDWVLQVRRDVDALRRAARHHRVAALLALDPATAVRVATEGTGADPYDELAVRDLMRALAADGRAAAALSAYDRLARTLREDLGTDPDRATSDLHLALLRETPVDGDAPTSGPDRAGRSRRCRWSAGRRRWRCSARRGVPWSPRPRPTWCSWSARAGSARPGSSTRWPISASRRVVRSCGAGATRRSAPSSSSRSSTRSARHSPDCSATTSRRRCATTRPPGCRWCPTSLPWSRTLRLHLPTATSSAGRRTTRCAAALRRLSVARPLVLVLDDLQDAGAATVDLLGYLARQLGTSRVLLVGAVRTEDLTVAERLGDRATRIHLGPLGPEAVATLAAAAGLGPRGGQVMARTAGHTLSVVECLRALRSGDTGVPASLSQGLLARVDRLGPESRSVVEAGAVLRRRLDPRLLAGLAEVSEVAATRHGEELTRAGLFVRSGAVYEFANDLFQECVYAALPQAVAAAYHRRAADLTSDRPEVMATHAHAVGDDARAAQGWLLAGEEALRRAAVEDARTLVERCLAVPGLAGETGPGRCWCAGGCTRPARLDRRHPGHRRGTRLGPHHSASAGSSWPPSAPVVGTRPSAPSCPPTSSWDRSRTAYDSPSELGDRRAEADFGSRLTVLEASRLRLSDASVRAGRVVARARASGSQDGLVLALDGLKTVAWHLGDAPALRAAVRELEPLVRERHDAWLLQWVVFESAFVPAAHGDWDEARRVLDDALDLNRRSGFPAYAGYLQAYDGWFARLAGDLDDARRLGRRSVEATSAVDHPWWHSWAAGLLAATLVETGETAEAESVARAGLAALSGTARPGRLLCAAAAGRGHGGADPGATEALSPRWTARPAGRGWWERTPTSCWPVRRGRAAPTERPPGCSPPCARRRPGRGPPCAGGWSRSREPRVRARRAPAGQRGRHRPRAPAGSPPAGPARRRAPRRSGPGRSRRTTVPVRRGAG